MLTIKKLADLETKTVPWLSGEFSDIKLWNMLGKTESGMEFDNLLMTITSEDGPRAKALGIDASTSIWTVDGEYCPEHECWEYELPQAYPPEEALMGVWPTRDHEETLRALIPGNDVDAVVVEGDLRA